MNYQRLGAAIGITVVVCSMSAIALLGLVWLMQTLGPLAVICLVVFAAMAAMVYSILGEMWENE